MNPKSQSCMKSPARIYSVLTRTREPFRAIESLKAYAYGENPKRAFHEWTVLSGWKTHNMDNPQQGPSADNALDPFVALKAIMDPANPLSQTEHAVYVMMYPHKHLAQGHPGMIQVLKEYVRQFTELKKRLVIITPLGFNLPPELEDDVAILDFEVPSYFELANCFEETLKLIPENKRPDVEDEFKRRLVNLGGGMTMMEYENALSRAFVIHKTSLPRIGEDDFAKVIASVKTEVVKRSEVLELMEAESMSNVGGLDMLKLWMSKRQTAFTDETRNFGIEPPKGIALIGPHACVAGTTVLNIRRGIRNHGREITIANAYNKLHGLGRYSGAQWQDELECFVPAMLDDRIGYHQISDIVKSGPNETFIITAENGYSLRATAEHRFKVREGTEGADSEGFRMLKNLSAGDRVIVRSDEKYQGGRKPNRERRVTYSVPHHPHGWANVVRGRDYKRIAYARLVLEAQMNSLSVEELIVILRKQPATAATLTYIDPALEIHHKDGDPMNDHPSNLEPISKINHLYEHADEKQKNFGDVLYREETIRSIRRFRREPTYDLIMTEPHQNYVAQGFIVHNSSRPET